METLVKAVIFSAAALLSSPCFAITGNDLWTWHRAANGLRSNAIVFYVRGLAESEAQYSALYREFAPARSPGFFSNAEWDMRHPQPFCMPEAADYGQAYDLVIKHLEDFPANRHQDARHLIRSALRAAWPCLGK